MHFVVLYQYRHVFKVASSGRKKEAAMRGTDWFEVERRARRLRAQEIQRLLRAALAAVVRAGAAIGPRLARWRRRVSVGATDATA